MAKISKTPSTKLGWGGKGLGPATKMASAAQPQLSHSNAFAQKLMTKGSFSTSSCKPKMGASNFGKG